MHTFRVTYVDYNTMKEFTILRRGYSTTEIREAFMGRADYWNAPLRIITIQLEA